jgi:phosphotransferase family enzyme
LLDANGLAGVAEAPFPNDGWSGATLTLIQRGRDRFVLKRTSAAMDWIVRATNDVALREGVVANGNLRLVEPLVAPYLGTASDGEGIAILMPDLAAELIAWERPNHAPGVSVAALERVLDAAARLHAMPWAEYRPTTPDWSWPWCPLRERLLLLTRPAAERYRAEGLAVGERFLSGWDAFDRTAPAAARALVEQLSIDPSPLIEALGRLPSTGLHGDLKLANVALFDDGRVAFIDWQMMALAPVTVELGWLLVANSSSLPIDPGAVLEGYRLAAERAAIDSMRLAGSRQTLPPRGLDATIGDWATQVDLTWIVGLLLRGWRKGLDAEAGETLGSGVSAAEDLAFWCDRAIEAVSRRLA